MPNDKHKHPLIMGIINVTPDSFSGDGVMKGGDPVAAAVDLALRMIDDGAAMLDIGGESSRPGAVPVSADEEIARVLPVIAALAKKTRLPIAVDTTKASVAKAALDAGAVIINDISALLDVDMAPLIANRGAQVVLMHNRSQSATQNDRIGGEYAAPAYGHIVEDVAADLAKRMKIADAAGIANDKIIADPGLGFGKTPEQNCALINHLDKLKAKLGCATLIGPSRKSFIGRMLDLPPEERLEGTAVAVAMGVLRGADIVRVHDVKFMVRIVKMTSAIAGS